MAVDIEYKEILPITNVVPLIPKKDIWMIWLTDDENRITAFQIYDLSKEEYLPFDHSKAYRTFAYIKYRMEGKPYLDWGANCSSYGEETQLADILFKFGVQYGFRDQKVVRQFLNQLSMIKEWREDIVMYMRFMGMEPYYTDI